MFDNSTIIIEICIINMGFEIPPGIYYIFAQFYSRYPHPRNSPIKKISVSFCQVDSLPIVVLDPPTALGETASDEFVGAVVFKADAAKDVIELVLRGVDDVVSNELLLLLAAEGKLVGFTILLLLPLLILFVVEEFPVAVEVLCVVVHVKSTTPPIDAPFESVPS